MVHMQKQHDGAAVVEGATIHLSDEQFNILVDLLTPGFEMASIMLRDYKSKQEPAPTEDKTDPAGDTAS